MQTITNVLNSLLVLLGCAWDILGYSLGWTNRQLQAIDYHKQGHRLLGWGYIIFAALLLFFGLAVYGLYTGYYYEPKIGFRMLVAAGILWLLIFWSFKLLIAVIGTAVFLVRLAKAITINPAIWTLKETGQLIWDVSTWPFDFSFDVIKRTLGGLLSVFGVEESTIQKLLTGTPEVSSYREGAWDEANRRLNELAQTSKQISLIVAITFKHVVVAIGMTSVWIMAFGGPGDPNSPFGFFHHPAAPVILIILFSLWLGKIGQEQYDKEMGRRA